MLLCQIVAHRTACLTLSHEGLILDKNTDQSSAVDVEFEVVERGCKVQIASPGYNSLVVFGSWRRGRTRLPSAASRRSRRRPPTTPRRSALTTTLTSFDTVSVPTCLLMGR